MVCDKPERDAYLVAARLAVKGFKPQFDNISAWNVLVLGSPDVHFRSRYLR
jgi:hypothetical protein